MENYAKNSTFFFLLMLASTLTLSLSAAAKPNGDKYVRDACRVTRYRGLCVRSLAPFSSAARASPSRWARAGVSVTITEAKSVALYLDKLKRHGNTRMSGSSQSRAALSDCIECFDSAVDELHRSLGVLRSLSKHAFAAQMGDLVTWLSAALTDADTCLDGFRGLKGTREVRVLRSRVSRASCVMSNALALVNKLASDGFRASNP